MKKKIASLLMAIMVLVCSIPSNSFADENKKIIFINMDRTSLENMLEIPILKEELGKRSYIGLTDNGNGISQKSQSDFKEYDGKYQDRKSTRLNSSHTDISRMPSSA